MLLKTRSGKTLFCAVLTVTLLWAGNVQAIYVNMGINQRVASGNHAEVSIDGSSITISFSDGPVSLGRVVLSRLYRGEVAVVGTEALSGRVAASSRSRRIRSYATVYTGGSVVSDINISPRGWSRGIAVQGRGFSHVGVIGSGGPRPQPASAIPEPHGALLFVAGLGVAAYRRRR